MSIDPKKFGLSNSLVNAVNEALKGGQVKLDKNHNGKLDADDFKKLRGEDKDKEQAIANEQSPAEYEKANFKHSMLGTDKRMKNEVADGNKANFKQNMKEAVEQIDEKVKTTHENPLVTVHDKHGLHTHANLSTANKIFNTKVKHTDVHAGAVKTKDGHETKNNLTFAISKHHASAMKEEVEQIDELSKKTMGSYIKKASHDVATKSAATGRYADRANTVKDQMKKGDYSNYQQGKKDDAIADKMFNKSWKRREGIAKATDKLTKEEVEQIDELSPGTLSSYKAKAAGSETSLTNKSSTLSVPAKDRNAAAAKANQRRIGMKLATKKLGEESVDEAATKLVAKPQYDKARPAFGANVAADMAARKTEVQRKIAAKQAATQQAKANKRISGSPVKEAKCTCDEGKGSKMTCEVCNSDKGLKGGKEPIIMNPPLKEASNLPKAVVSKGHEIAKSLIKHKSTVKEPYAVGMAAAKKSAGIKD